MTTRENIREFLDRRQPGHTHMLVVCDTFDWGDYPIFTDDPAAAVEKYPQKNMQKVMEVYDLSIDLEDQLNGGRVWNIAPAQNRQ